VGFSHGPLPAQVIEPQPKPKQCRGKWKALLSEGNREGGGKSKPRKERDPNWNRVEMLALVRAKRAEFIEELEADDPRLFMNSEMTKWERISVSVSSTDGIECIRTAEACKYKWQTLMPDYKRIADLHKETGMNSLAYFEMSYSQRRE
jgi:hypothetical protein